MCAAQASYQKRLCSEGARVARIKCASKMASAWRGYTCRVRYYKMLEELYGTWAVHRAAQHATSHETNGK